MNWKNDRHHPLSPDKPNSQGRSLGKIHQLADSVIGGKMNCPFCGAPEFLPMPDTGIIVFECETELRNKGQLDEFTYEGRECYRNQIAVLTAELAEVKAKLAEREERLNLWRGHYGSRGLSSEGLWKQALKALGEI